MPCLSRVFFEYTVSLQQALERAAELAALAAATNRLQQGSGFRPEGDRATQRGKVAIIFERPLPLELHCATRRDETLKRRP